MTDHRETGQQPAQPASLLRPAVVASAADCQKPRLVVTRGDGVPLPDQAAAIAEFKRQCLQLAQPGSGEVLARLRKLEKDVDSGKHYGFQQDIWTVAANEIDRLQSDLTAAKADAAFNKRGWDGAFLQAMENGGKANDLRNQLIAAQRRIDELESENADLRNRLNLSEKRQGRFPRDATQPKDPT